MKRTMYILLLIIAVIGLSACGSKTTDSAEGLQEHKWNIVSTNGESYTGEFSESTVTFKSGNMSRGFSYSIDDKDIYLEEGDNEAVVFEIEKDGEEYNFKAKTDEVKGQFGNLTLSPSKE